MKTAKKTEFDSTISEDYLEPDSEELQATLNWYRFAFKNLFEKEFRSLFKQEYRTTNSGDENDG